LAPGDWIRLRFLEAELGPGEQMTQVRLDGVLAIEVCGGTDIEEIDVKRANVVVVDEVLRLHADDQRSTIKMQPGGGEVFLGSDIPVLRTWIFVAIAADLVG